MSAPLCTVCLDTGSKSQEMGGDLDCTVCTAADDRSGLRWLLALRPSEDDSDVWRAYQLGKAAAAPVVPVAAQPVVPAPQQPMVGRLLDELSALPVLWGLNEPGALLRHGQVFDMMVKVGKEYAAPQPAASVTDVAKDASRFAWLIGNVVSGSIGFGDWWINADEPAEEWRAAIDAAIAAQQGEKT